MANNEAGAFLNITPDVLNKLDSFDKKLASIEQHAHTAADALKNGFGKVTLDTSRLEGALNALSERIESLKAAGGALQNIGSAASGAVSLINSVTSGLSQTSQIVNSLSVIRPFDNWNIAELKAEIASLNESLTNGIPTIRGGKLMSQQEIVDRRNMLQEELKIQEASTSAKLSAIAKVSKAQNADAEAQRKRDEKVLQEHLKGLEDRSERERKASAEWLRIGTERLEAEKKNILETQRLREKTNASVDKSVRKEIEDENKKYYDDLNKQIIAAQKNQETQQNLLEQKRKAELEFERKYNKEVENEKKRYYDNLNKQIIAAQNNELTQQKLAEQQNKARLQQEKEYNREVERERKAHLKRLSDEIKAAQKNQQIQEKLSRQIEVANLSKPKGALQYSSNAKTLQQDIQAIEYLKKARLSLDKTDAKYRDTLNAINIALAKHDQALREAGVHSNQLQKSHSKVMDTAGQLQRKLALLFSVSQVQGYIQKIAEVRGEFELQQRSLQAILQNKTQADQIFNKTVELAIKSPFQIKQLVTYTKQMAAYRIESSKLYDTTKRLADVSAGLGVDMQRLILAYGQVKAAAYLRGTEVRQFTEAGINMYGELQAYFKEVKNEAYTTAEIVDMISKRKVTFQDVEAVFQRLTDKGGLFYNMQEIQAETLRGKISNLKDSIDVMLNDIGKANEGTIKGAIDVIKTLIDNWQKVLNIAKAFSAVIASVGLAAWNKSIIDAGKGTSLFAVALTKAGASVKAFGAILKSSLPTALIFGTIEAIMHLIAVQKEYMQAQKEAEDKYYKGIVRTDEIEKLSVTIDERTSKPMIKEALSQLVKEMNNEGFNIEINVNLSDEEAKKEYDKLLQMHKKYLDDMLVLDYQYNKNKKENAWFWQKDADEVNKNLAETRQKAVAIVNDVRMEIAKLLDKGTGIDSKMREELIRLQKGVEESGSLEAIQKYYDEVLYYLNQIKDSKEVWAGNVGIAGIERFEMKSAYAGISSSVFEGLDGLSRDLDKAKKEMTKMLRKHFDNMFALNTYDNEAKAAYVNNFATAHGWALDLVQQISSALYDIDFSVAPKPDKTEPAPVDKKMQRDILAERIALIKELNREYEKLKKVMGSDAAAATVMKRYAEELKDVQMPKNIIGDNFLPTKENTERALREYAKTITDFRKRMGAQRDANVLFDENVTEEISKQLDKTKKNIEDMFNGLDLHKKLKDAGLSEAEVQELFPGLAKTLDDVANGIKEAFKKNFPGGEYLVPDTDANKQYVEEIKKLNQKRIKDSQDLIIELTKNYKTQLSDQLQLDRWYYEERAKIQMANLTQEQKNQYEANLKSMYDKKTDENTWKQFQNSDMYISLFENMEGSSTLMLQAMRDKLASLRSELKDLPADQLKAIISQQEKIDEMLATRNPFEGLTDGVKKYIEFQKIRNDLEIKYVNANNAISVLTDKQKEQSGILQQKKKEYDLAVETNGLNSSQANELKVQVHAESAKLDAINAQLDKEKQISEETGEQIRNGQNLAKTLKAQLNEIGGYFSEFSSGITGMAGDLENIFGTMGDGLKDAFETVSEIAGGVGQTINGVTRIMEGDIIRGGLQAAGGLFKAIGGLFNIKDKKKEREIQNQIKTVDDLAKKYDKLRESMSATWESITLHQETQAAIDNIDQRIASHEAMIKAEEDKKKTDEDRINEWKDAIEELQNTKKEIMKEEQMNLGAIGDDNEYKTAAEDFVSSWMDAFKETGKGIDELKESFDDLIQNLIVKQATMRLAQTRLKTLFEAIDKSVTEQSEGGINLTKQELADINALADTALAGLNDDLKALMETLGYKGGSQKAELSALTESVQSITQQTAEELAALLNSVRFFVAQQTNDITAIRSLLDARLGMAVQEGESNPMLVELRAQTSYLEILSDRIDRVFAPSANSKGAGLRVFIG